MHLIKGVDEVVNNNKIFQQEEEELIYILKVETKTAIDSIIVAGTETPLNIVSITL